MASDTVPPHLNPYVALVRPGPHKREKDEKEEQYCLPLYAPYPVCHTEMIEYRILVE